MRSSIRSSMARSFTGLFMDRSFVDCPVCSFVLSFSPSVFSPGYPPDGSFVGLFARLSFRLSFACLLLLRPCLRTSVFACFRQLIRTCFAWFLLLICNIRNTHVGRLDRPEVLPPFRIEVHSKFQHTCTL